MPNLRVFRAKGWKMQQTLTLSVPGQELSFCFSYFHFFVPQSLLLAGDMKKHFICIIVCKIYGGLYIYVDFGFGGKLILLEF